MVPHIWIIFQQILRYRHLEQVSSQKYIPVVGKNKPHVAMHVVM